MVFPDSLANSIKKENVGKGRSAHFYMTIMSKSHFECSRCGLVFFLHVTNRFGILRQNGVQLGGHLLAALHNVLGYVIIPYIGRRFSILKIPFNHGKIYGL